MTLAVAEASLRSAICGHSGVDAPGSIPQEALAVNHARSGMFGKFVIVGRLNHRRGYVVTRPGRAVRRRMLAVLERAYH